MTIKYKCLYEITGRIEDVNTFLVPLRELPKKSETRHWSDCALHSEPAYPKGECDCGGYKPEQEPVAHINQHGVIHEAGYPWEPTNRIEPLYRIPPKSKPLTKEQAFALFGEFYNMSVIRNVEAAHGIKENT